MERALGYIIGAGVAILILGAVFMLFGGVIIGAASAILAFPFAAPMTTCALLIALFIGYIGYCRRRSENDRS